MLNRRMRGAGGIGPMYGTGKSTQSVDLCSLHSPCRVKTKKKLARLSEGILLLCHWVQSPLVSFLSRCEHLIRHFAKKQTNKQTNQK